MQPKNLADIQKSFTAQAQRFENTDMNFTKQEYLDYTVRCMHLTKDDCVLETAAGTCACGRSIAPHVSSVICLDATPAMLAVGQAEAVKSGLANMRFVEGYVEKLPFEDGAFDAVLTRLSFHHFAEMEAPFAEMHRVLKRGGQLVIIDMEAAAEALREVEDKIETLRDPSHVKNRSQAEFARLFEAHGYTMLRREATLIAVSLKAWLALTNTPEEEAGTITAMMEEEMAGGKPTGFGPYRKADGIFFNQRWLFMQGMKAGGLARKL